MMSYHQDAGPPSQAPPSPPLGPRSPPIPTSRFPQTVDRRSSSFDEGDGQMDEAMTVRQIWLKLGLLDTINYKMDTTLKKLSMLENRMDRLETSVREAGVQRMPGAVNGAADNGLNDLPPDDGHMPMDLKDPPPKKLPKPLKAGKPLFPSRPAPSVAPTSSVQANPTPFAQANPTPFAQANPAPFSQASLAPFSQANQVNPIPKPPHQVITPAAASTTNIVPPSCLLNITNKEECERKLRMHRHNGMYLVRKSDKTPNARVLMVWFQENGICKHYKIFGDQISIFQLDETPNFTSLIDLIEYYREYKLPQSDVLLTRPYPG